MPDLPHGYRANAAGLLVPDALARAREVWTRDEWKQLDRAAKLLAARGVLMVLRCGHADCHKEPIQVIKGVVDVTLRCGHLDRVFTRAF